MSPDSQVTSLDRFVPVGAGPDQHVHVGYRNTGAGLVELLDRSVHGLAGPPLNDDARLRRERLIEPRNIVAGRTVNDATAAAPSTALLARRGGDETHGVGGAAVGGRQPLDRNGTDG